MPYLTQEELDSGILDKYKTNAEDVQKQHALQWNNNPNYRKLFQDQTAANPNKVTPMEEERTLGGTLKDIGVSTGKGIVGAAEGIVGLADLVTPGNLGGGLERMGLDLGGMQESLYEQYSPAQQAAFKKVEEAKGFLSTLGSMVANPSTLGHAIVESAPSMLAGGAIGRGLGAAAKIPGLVGGAIGEGAMTAGQTQENVRRQSGGDTTLGQQMKAIGAGIGTGAIGLVGGKIAQKLGIADVDTMLAGGKLAEKTQKGVTRRIVEGGISEGVFEELPQSMQEQVWMNAATGQPLDTDVGKSGAAGLLAGAAMGGGANIFTQPTGKQPTEVDVQKSQADKISGDILSQGKEKATEALTLIDQQTELVKNILDDPQALALKASELGMDIKEATDYIKFQAQINQQVKASLTEGLVTDQERFDAGMQTVPEEGMLEQPFASLQQEKENIRQAELEEQVATGKEDAAWNQEEARFQQILNERRDQDKFQHTERQDPEHVLNPFKTPNYLEGKQPQDLITQKREWNQRFLSDVPEMQQPLHMPTPNEFAELSEQEQAQVFGQEEKALELIRQKETTDVALTERLKSFEERIEQHLTSLQDIPLVEGQQETQLPIVEGPSDDQVLLTDYSPDKVKPYDPFAQITQALGGKVNPREYQEFQVERKRQDDLKEQAQQDEITFNTVQETDLVSSKQQLFKTQGAATTRINKEANPEAYVVMKIKGGYVGRLQNKPETVVPEELVTPEPTQRSQGEQQVAETEMPEADTQVEDPQSERERQLDELMNTFNTATKKTSQVSPKEQKLSSALDATQDKIFEWTSASENAPNAAEKGQAYKELTKLEVTKKRLTQQLEAIQTPKFQVTQKKETHTDTPAFKRWFGKSVAKTKDGTPAAFYHGTPNDFTVFEDRAGESTTHIASGLGHFFSMDKDYAGSYAKDGGNVLETYLKMEKPYKMPLEQAQSLPSIEASRQAKQQLMAKGYDSVIIPIPGAQPYIVVFNPEQIKSVDNQGTFDPTNPDIRFETALAKETSDELSLEYIKDAYPDQEVVSTPTGIQVNLQNGSQITVDFTSGATSSEMNLALTTNQIGEGGVIKGATTGTNVRLFEGFADKGTFWHENKHVIDNLGLMTEAENSALLNEFSELQRTGKLNFTLSTHQDPALAMEENIANTFAQVMTSREDYQSTPLGGLIQKIIDFFHGLWDAGKATTRSIARDVETGKMYNRARKKNNINTQFMIMPVPKEKLPDAVKHLLDLPYWKHIKNTKQLYRNKEFFTATGFWLDQKGNWNYEIDDSKAVYKPDSFNDPYAKLPDVLDYPELFNVLPELKDIDVYSDYTIDSKAYADKDSIVLRNVKDKKSFFHEINHLVDRMVNGFRGSSPDKARDRLTLKNSINRLKELNEKVTNQKAKMEIEALLNISQKDFNASKFRPLITKLINKDLTNLLSDFGELEAAKIARFPLEASQKRGFVQYRQVPGEMKSRLTESRLSMSVQERKAEAPWETLDKMLSFEGYKPAVGKTLFQVAEQTISNEEYLQLHKQTKNLWNRVKKQSRIQKTGLIDFADKYLTPISTRLANINPLLAAKTRQLDFDTTKVIADQIKTAEPVMQSTKEMSPEDRTAWDWARKNRDLGKIQYITEKYGIEEDYSKVKDLLNQVHADAKSVGYDVGYIEDYWPRVLKDVEGFLQATKEISTRDVFSRALKAEAAKQGIEVVELDPLVRADIISNLILGRGIGIGGPGNIQGRVFNQIPEEFAEFYMDSDGALMQYIYSMNKKIEARKFFGKVPEKIAAFKRQRRSANNQLIKLQDLVALAVSEGRPNEYVEKITALQQDLTLADQEINKYAKQTDFTSNIGSYVDSLLATEQIKPGDEQALRDILDARFHEHGTRGNVNAYKNLAYIDTMGNPFSALTQIGDLAWAYYVGGMTPSGLMRTTKNIVKAAVGKAGIKKEDLGFERIAQEFADNGSLSNAVSRVFKIVGLEKMDSIGKEALINNSFENYKLKAQQDPDKLKKEIRHIFGDQTDQVVTDLIGNNPSENVKLLLYNRVLDFQPVALSEMPEKYLNAGNGRIFYMLKTFTLKQMDVFRREVFQNFKKGDPESIKQGMVNMAQLTFLLTVLNAGADELKDYLKGDEVKFEDNIIENLLSIGGASRFMQLQVNQEGFGSAMLQKILPPVKFIDSLSQDIVTDTSKGYRTLDSVPIAGKLLYWHMGRGSEFTSTEKEKEFKKAVKTSNKFKKQLDAADNRREFIYANMEDFRRSKKIQAMQSTLNKNKALINKLKEMKQTTNVRKRISQLEQRRELFLQRFFAASDNG